MNPAKRQEIFRRWREANPHPQSDLEYASPFELLVAVILSAQATDKGVNAATRKLYAVANTPAAILRSGKKDWPNTSRPSACGRPKRKTSSPPRACCSSATAARCRAPREALEALPGVGRKTANVVLNVIFGQPTIAVDTHNFRVANRTGIAPGKTVEQVERGLMKFVPPEFMLHAHHWLILHGRYVCKAQKPDCPNCNISDLCEYKHKTPDPLAQPAPAVPRKSATRSPTKPASGPGAKRAARVPAKTSAKSPAKPRAAKAPAKRKVKAAAKKSSAATSRKGA